VRLPIREPDTPGGFRANMACKPVSRSATAEAISVGTICYVRLLDSDSIQRDERAMTNLTRGLHFIVDVLLAKVVDRTSSLCF